MIFPNGMFANDSIFLHLATYLIQATLLILVGLTIGRLCRWNAAKRYQLLLVTWVSLLVLPALNTGFQRAGLSICPDFVASAFRHETNQPPLIVSYKSQSTETSQLSGKTNMGKDDVAYSTETRSLVFSRRFVYGFFFVWGAGGFVLLIRLAVASVKIATLLSNAKEQPVDCRLRNIGNRVSREMKSRRLPDIRVSVEIHSPAVVGLLCPVIVIPKPLVARLSDEELRHVLLHEMAHVVRNDQLILLMQRILGALAWIHPLTHILNREITRVREEVCDNHVLGVTDQISYGRTLLNVSQMIAKTNQQPLVLAVGLLTNGWSLEERVSLILNKRRITMTKVGIRATAANLVFVLAITVLAGFCHPAWGANPTQEDENISFVVIDANGKIEAGGMGLQSAINELKFEDETKREDVDGVIRIYRGKPSVVNARDSMRLRSPIGRRLLLQQLDSKLLLQSLNLQQKKEQLESQMIKGEALYLDLESTNRHLDLQDQKLEKLRLKNNSLQLEIDIFTSRNELEQYFKTMRDKK